MFCSIWLNQCQAVFLRHHSQAGENPELRTLFFRLARLLRVPVTVVFVFDGPIRPSMKRGKSVATKSHWLTSSFQELITAFGFHRHNVSGCILMSTT
jgi:holliday junction resolvase YEN1